MESEFNPELIHIIKSSNEQENILKFKIDAIKKKLGITCFILLCILIIILYLGLPITQIIIGSIYYNSCPIDNRIPQYLIIAGCGSLVCFTFAIIKNFTKKSSWRTFFVFKSGILCIIWFIVGSVWIIHAKKRVQYLNPYDIITYCEHSLFIFVSVTIFFNYGSIIALLGYHVESER